jgi:hypothetical protein
VLLSAILLSVQAATASLSGPLHSALLKSQAVINKLDILINTKLLRHDHGSHKAHRRAWVTNRRKVIKLRDKLQEAREDLSGALTAELLYVRPSQGIKKCLADLVQFLYPTD